MRSAYMLNYVKTNEQLREKLLDADIIAFNVPLINPAIGGCCYDSSASKKDGCFAESVEEYKENTRLMIQEIQNLVGDRGAIIYVQSSFVPVG